MKTIRQLVGRMATENSGWGYGRIRGELKKLDHNVAKSTIAKTLKEHGIAPAPDRPSSWRTFLRSHADVIAADRLPSRGTPAVLPPTTCCLSSIKQHAVPTSRALPEAPTPRSWLRLLATSQKRRYDPLLIEMARCAST